jgi:hypothetical protein
LEISARNPNLLDAINGRVSLQIALLNDLRSNGRSSSELSILGNYLQDIRRDGPTAHVAVKRRIDRLASNTEELLALLEAYPPASKPGPLKQNVEDFQRYANIWLDRKNSVLDLYLLGGNFPPGEPEFPKELLQALKQSE